MRIAFAYDVPYPWHVGGIEVLNYNEVRELAKENEVHFFTTKWPGMPGWDFEYNKVRYHARHGVDRDKLYRHGRRSIREAILYSVGLFRLFDYDFDVVVGNYFPIIHVPLLWLYCKLRGSKLVLEVAEVWDRDYWLSYIGWPFGYAADLYANMVINMADAYVSDSSVTAQKLVDRGVARGKITTYAPCIEGAEMESIAKAARGRQRRRIIYSGRLIKEKRLDKWLDTVKAVSEIVPDVEGVIIGKGPELEGIKERVRRLGLSGTVKLLPFYEDKRDLYRAISDSALMLHMSEREGFGIVCVESISLGTPVVLPSYTPIPKEVRSMCVVGDEKDLPRKIVEILRSKRKSSFIRNRGNMDNFMVSSVNRIYGSIFRRIGLKVRK
jgi:glycosyltransferase involved in cell wall biosynthesis